MDNRLNNNRYHGNTLLQWVTRAEDLLLVTCLVVMILLAFTNILLRNVAGGGIVWADRMLTQLVLWIAIMGGAVSTRKNDHIRIDVVSHFIPEPYKPVLHTLTDLFSSCVSFVLAYASLMLVITIEYPDHRLIIPHMESWVPMIVMPLGFCIMGIRFFRYSVLSLVKMVKNSR